MTKEKVIDATEYNERIEQYDREQQLKAVFNSDIHNSLRRKRDLQSIMGAFFNSPYIIDERIFEEHE